MIHELVHGRRYPACTLPDVPRSIYEVVCKCGLSISAFSWDEALDLYLERHDVLVAVVMA